MHSAAIGSMVAGRYRVEQSLGRGTYGEVYRVWDTHQAQSVALKLIDPAKIAGWPWDEASRLTRLRSDFILPIWNADIVSGVPYIVTDVAQHGSVDLLVNRGPLAPRVAVQTIRDAARGVARTHDDGVVHRDIKLENLFVGGDGRTMLGDFGLAHPLDANGEAPRDGTPVTAAPEVLAGAPTTRASDIYSLGACLYACLAGAYAYNDKAKNRAELAALVAAGPPPSIRDVAPTVGRLLSRAVESAMSRDPSQRPSAAELDGELGRIQIERDWMVDAHPGHDTCWESPGNSALHVCTIAAGRRTEILVTHQPSGRRILAHCGSVTNSQLPSRLRATFERLGN